MNNLTEKEKQAIRELVDELKNLYGDNLTCVILYGSKARGDFDHNSDIDLMIILKEYKQWNKEFEKISDITYSLVEKYDYDLLFSTIVRDENWYFNRNTPLLLNVRKEGIKIYERD